MTDYGVGVFEHHAALLHTSAISTEVAHERGYVSVDTTTRLEHAGFAKAQRRPPGLLIPWHAVDGDVVVCEYRPDSPRLDSKTGKEIKYERPFGSVARLDFAPSTAPSAHDPSVTVFVTEGARKVDSATTAGLFAIGLAGVWGWKSNGGALADWHDVALKGREAVIAFDRDVMTNPNVAKALQDLTAYLRNKHAHVRFLVLPDLGDGHTGLDDFLGAGNTVKELRSLVVDELPSASGKPPVGRRLVLTRGTDVELEEVSFLHDRLIPRAALSIVVGEPGLAKTTLVLAEFAQATLGTLPGDLYGRARSVLIYSGEDRASNVLKPRLMAHQANLKLVHFITVEDGGIEDGLTLPADVELLRDAIDETASVAVMIDPLFATIGDGIDSHRDHSMRRALSPLFRLADTTGVAIIAVAHVNKSTASDFMRRLGASIGLLGAVRSAMLIARDPERLNDPAARVIVHAKHNLSEAAPTRRFRVVSATVGDSAWPMSVASIEWGEDCQLTVEDVLRIPVTERTTPKRDAARDLLHELLDDGPQMSVTIKNAAQDRGVSWRTVEAAKADLGIEDEQRVSPGVRGRGPSWWFFPSGARSTGPQHIDTDWIADHSSTTAASRDAGSEWLRSNGPQAPRWST